MAAWISPLEASVSELTRLIIIVIASGILAQVVSGIFRLPSIIFLLLFGVLLGPQGLKVIQPSDLGHGLEVIVALGVAVILFEGSMSLNLRHTKEVHRSVRMLCTFGLLFTFVAAGTAAHYLMGLSWKMAALFGSLVTVTGPTVIRPLIRRINVRREVATILEGEGILIDPLGAILAVLCIEFALGSTDNIGEYLKTSGIRIGAGAIVGAVVGGLTALIIRHRQHHQEGLKNLIVLACAFGCYGVAEMIEHETGIMAVVVAGLLTQLGMKHHEKELKEFKEQITTLLISILFVLLASNLDLLAMRGLGIWGLVTVLTVMFVIRPINVFASTMGGKPNFREKVFLSWTAPRGIIAASVASLAYLKLSRHAAETNNPVMAEEAVAVQSLVFMAVGLTVMVQGSTAGLFAKLLRITANEEGTVLIIGANNLGREIGKRFHSRGREVVMLDTNPYHCDLAEKDGLTAICGSATDRDVLRHAGILDAGSMIAATESARINEMSAQVGHIDFDVKNVLCAIDSTEKPKLDPILERQGIKVAFGRPVPMDTWAGDLAIGTARIDAVEITKENCPTVPIKDMPWPDTVVPIMVERDGQVFVTQPATKILLGDTLHLLHARVAMPILKSYLGIPPKEE